MQPIEYFLATYGLRESEVTFVPYGSRVYGTHKPWSDYDYIAIVPENRRADTGTEYRRGNTDIHIYNRRHFQEQLTRHKIHALEAHFHPQSDSEFEFSLSLERLQDSIGEKSSHSFVRAKKKMELENDLDLGRKSLFHAMRILDFGIQVATEERIVDYSTMNHVWFAITEEPEYNWQAYSDRYTPVYKDLQKRFRKVTTT